LAKLFAKPANVIVLDEPTNDLDAESVELLEDRLVEYRGTLLLISHDREFLNNVVTSTIVFEPAGVNEYVGGYDDWLRQRPEPATEKAGPRRGTAARTVGDVTSAESTGLTSKPQRRRLTYREQQELAALPETIEQLEADLAKLHEAMTQPDFYKRPGDQIAATRCGSNNSKTSSRLPTRRWKSLLLSL